VVSAKIAADGTITVDYKVTDPTGLALDIAGIQTPGTISRSLLAAYIPKGQAEYVSYSTRVSTAVTGGATAIQASADSGGATQTVAVGEYIYTFKTKAPAGFDATATNRIGIYGFAEPDAMGPGYELRVHDVRLWSHRAARRRRETSYGRRSATHATARWRSMAVRAGAWIFASCATRHRPPTPTRATRSTCR